MKIKLGNKELEIMKAMAIKRFVDEDMGAIESNLFPTAITIQVFVDYLNAKHDANIVLDLPTRQHYQTLDEE